MNEREKYWSELSAVEKLERIRDVVKGYRGRVEDHEELLVLLMRHKHLKESDGVVVEILEHRISGSAKALKIDPDKEWF